MPKNNNKKRKAKYTKNDLFRFIWFIIVLTFLTIFVICKWPWLVYHNYFKDLNGERLIFLLWLIFLLLPLININGMDMFGKKVSANDIAPPEKERISESTDEEVKTINSFNKKVESNIKYNITKDEYFKSLNEILWDLLNSNVLNKKDGGK